MAAVMAREERHNTPSTCSPLLQALAHRVEWVLMAMSPPPQWQQGDGGGDQDRERGPQGRHETADGETTAHPPHAYTPAADLGHPLQVARGFFFFGYF